MPTQQPPTFISFIPFILIMGVFYLLIIRPQQSQQKKHREMLSRLRKNDEVVTAGGIHGTIVNVKEKTFILRIDENVRVEVDKTAVSSVKKMAD
ncbi:MAG: preprotein translocase subunit YajC [Candidatus Omnitrophica bacterium]|nr:preprotein translocase subunit YajC [Candidatus Omnitrophota bacterium]